MSTRITVDRRVLANPDAVTGEVTTAKLDDVTQSVKVLALLSEGQVEVDTDLLSEPQGPAGEAPDSLASDAGSQPESAGEDDIPGEDDTPLGDTPEAHDEINPHDLPKSHPGRQAAEEQAAQDAAATTPGDVESPL